MKKTNNRNGQKSMYTGSLRIKLKQQTEEREKKEHQANNNNGNNQNINHTNKQKHIIFISHPGSEWGGTWPSPLLSGPTHGA